MAKVWVNLYRVPPTFRGRPEHAINSDITVAGVYPGTGFYASRDAAMLARQPGDNNVIGLGEVDVPDELLRDRHG